VAVGGGVYPSGWKGVNVAVPEGTDGEKTAVELELPHSDPQAERSKAKMQKTKKHLGSMGGVFYSQKEDRGETKTAKRCLQFIPGPNAVPPG
jgi:hypothetical protein